MFRNYLINKICNGRWLNYLLLRNYLFSHQSLWRLRNLDWTLFYYSSWETKSLRLINKHSIWDFLWDHLINWRSRKSKHILSHHIHLKRLLHSEITLSKLRLYKSHWLSWNYIHTIKSHIRINNLLSKLRNHLIQTWIKKIIWCKTWNRHISRLHWELLLIS